MNKVTDVKFVSRAVGAVHTESGISSAEYEALLKDYFNQGYTFVQMHIGATLIAPETSGGYYTILTVLAKYEDVPAVKVSAK